MAWTRPSGIDPKARHASGLLPRHNHSKLRDLAFASLASLQFHLLVALFRLQLPRLRRRVRDPTRVDARHRKLRRAHRQPRDHFVRGDRRSVWLFLSRALSIVRGLLQGLLQHTRHRATPLVRSRRSHPGELLLQRTHTLHDRLRRTLLCLHAHGSVRKHQTIIKNKNFFCV